MNDLATAWRGASTGELCWLTADGPAAVPVVPLMVDQPCLALPLAHLSAVDSLPGRAAFCVSAPAGPDGPTLVATGTISVRLDVRGEEFGGDLVEQEVLKHPPSRLRVGSLMARKENWWWMARALVSLVEVDEVRALPARTRAQDAVLVREEASDARVDVVTAEDWSAGPGREVELWPRDGGDLAGDGGRALVMGHQASPDLERWERWTRTGTLWGQTLRVEAADGAPDPDPRPYRLLERLRNHREVERACKAGVAAVERRLGR
ncbi:hypothetical protein [Nocardiopsis sp. FR4]|uniref:hypothetical protein n=1 Tax=unclassified Nocardiopsis TaxID=2649073 RepID=UPI001F20179E|nr:hypothetical protein [Nocardiopsis sp. FR4]